MKCPESREVGMCQQHIPPSMLLVFFLLLDKFRTGLVFSATSVGHLTGLCQRPKLSLSLTVRCSQPQAFPTPSPIPVLPQLRWIPPHLRSSTRVKMALPGLGSGRNNLQTAIWGHSRQLDDQHRNPNINNKDHHVGQLTRGSPKSYLGKTQIIIIDRDHPSKLCLTMSSVWNLL